MVEWSASPSPPPPRGAEPIDLVNPFVGTQNFGNTFPGASAPFGMVQVSPDTGGQGGYDYKQDSIYGFSQTHLSGVGCGVMGELPIMPTTGAVDSVDPNTYRSPYSHDDEQASPGYYRVGLKKYDVDAELTATERTGWQRYTFPSTGSANVLFNTGKANQSVLDSEVHVVGDRTIEGRAHAGASVPDTTSTRCISAPPSTGPSRPTARGTAQTPSPVPATRRKRPERCLGDLRRDHRPGRRPEGGAVLHRCGGRP